jgi:hypothetical protein
MTPTFTPICSVHLWPDPYNPKYATNGLLKISCVPFGGMVSFFTVSGEMVNVLQENGGMVLWDGRNKSGILVSPGIYFYVIQLGNQEKGRGKFLIN